MPLYHSPELISSRRIAAEMLACVILDLFPSACLVGGGLISYGFYYDFIFEQPIDETLLALIETNLRNLAKEDAEIKSFEMTPQNAKDLLLHYNQPLLAEGIEEDGLTALIQLKKHYGICPEESISSTSEAGTLKLLAFEKVEGVTRIIGTAFDDPQSLKKFLKARENYKKKNHRLLGKELQFFHFEDAQSCFWLPRGEQFKQLLKNWIEKEIGRHMPIQKIKTPLQGDLLDHHLLLFEKKLAKVPLFEWAAHDQAIFEEEGLFSLQCITGDYSTAQIFQEELSIFMISSLQFFEEIIKIFGFEAHWVLVASRPKSLSGRLEKKALKQMQQVLLDADLQFPVEENLVIEEELPGPRLELQVFDEIGRAWAMSSLTLVTNKKRREDGVFVIKRVAESLERLIALLIERSEGCFPLWLAPEQVRVLSIGENAYAKEVEEACKIRGFRTALDKRDVKLNEKIHWAEKEKIPYLLLIGDQELKKQLITVRSARHPDKNKSMKLNDFLDQIEPECNSPQTIKGEFKLA